MSTIADESQGIVEEFESDFSTFYQNATDTHSAVGHTQAISEASLSKVDHMIYIQHAYRALELGDGSESWGKIQVSPSECRFGRWYAEGDGHNNFAHLPSYEDIDFPHRAVHQGVHELLDLLRGDWRHEPAQHQTILDKFGEIEAASKTLMALLSGLADEKQYFEQPALQNVGDIDLF